MKADVDEMFGWFAAALEWMKDNQMTVIEIEDLQKAVQQRFNDLTRRDPTAPVVRVLVDDAPVKPTTCYRLVPKNMHITRTYCISSRPCSYSGHGCRIFNHIFSTRPASVALTDWSIEPYTPAETDWRRGYGGAGRRNWDTQVTAMALHDESALTRRRSAQAAFLPHILDRRHGISNFAEEVQKIQNRAIRKKGRRLARAKALADRRAANGNESESSDTSSSTSADNGPWKCWKNSTCLAGGPRRIKNILPTHIIATSDDVIPKGSLVMEIPYFRETQVGELL